MSTMDYQPYLQAILLIAKHYRIETSEERIRLQMDWAGASAADEVVKTIARQIGLSVRKSKFSKEMLNPWRLPVIVVFKDGQVGVVDQADVDHNVSIQMSGDQGLAKVLLLLTFNMKLKVFISCDLKNQLQMRVLMNISNLMRVVGSGRSCYVTGNDISILCLHH